MIEHLPYMYEELNYTPFRITQFFLILLISMTFACLLSINKFPRSLVTKYNLDFSSNILLPGETTSRLDLVQTVNLMSQFLID